MLSLISSLTIVLPRLLAATVRRNVLGASVPTTSRLRWPFDVDLVFGRYVPTLLAPG